MNFGSKELSDLLKLQCNVISDYDVDGRNLKEVSC